MYPKSNRERFIPPKGQLLVTFEKAQAVGCIQAVNSLYFNKIMSATQLNPCDGCSIWEDEGPKCQAFVKYHSAHRQFLTKKQTTTANNSPEYRGLNMKTIAKRLHISLKEARRCKAAGTLRKVYDD